jgi:hypothetical protein
MDWRNLIAVTTVIVALAAFLFGVISWRLEDIDNRLDERLSTFHHEMDSVNQRIESIEQQLRIHRSMWIK